ncbi:response regulator [Nitrospira sp. Nam74]
MQQSRGTILIVEDDPYTRDIVYTIVSEAGHTVHLAKDGLDALTHLERHRYDVLVTDHTMPNLNGLYLLTIMKALWPQIPVVMVSGDTGHVKCRAIGMGAYAWLAKPYGPADLLSIIGGAMEYSYTSKMPSQEG